MGSENIYILNYFHHITQDFSFQNDITFCTERYESNVMANNVKAGILLFRPNEAHKGLDLGSQLKLWKSIKWAFFYCISLKLGICGHLILGGNKIFPEKHFFGLGSGQNRKKVAILSKKRKQHDFVLKR